jgi:hypothetical protein
LRLSSAIAASVTGGIRIPRAASPWPDRSTETADRRLDLPLYRTMKRILKRPINLLEAANQVGPASKAIDPALFFFGIGPCSARKGGLPPTFRHA